MKDLHNPGRLTESSISYTDEELLDFLEENNYKPTLTNLQSLKEGILNGDIVLEETRMKPIQGRFPFLPPKGEDAYSDLEDTNVGEFDRGNYSNEYAYTGKMLNKYKQEAKADEDELNDLFNGKDAEYLKEAAKDDKDGIKDIKKAEKDAKDYKEDPNRKLDPPFNGKAYVRPALIKNDSTKYTNKKMQPFKESDMIRLLESFLNEDCHGNINASILTEEVRSESVKQIAISLLRVVEEKLGAIDTTAADRSKGDIKQLRELQSIQDAINNLEEVIERDFGAAPECSKAVNIIIKSLLYINQYSNVFKDAYRNKKTLMIMKYQALILSIISSVSYLISVLIMFDKDNIELNKDIKTDIINFAPLKALSAFNQSVESGEFKIVSRDVDVLREYWLELPVEKMTSILEAVEYGPMIVDGIKNIYNNLISGNTKLTNLIYRAAGIFVLLLSLRDVLYTLFKMKTKINDMIQNIGIFANIKTLGTSILAKLGLFSNKFKEEAEAASDLSKREIEDENRRLLLDVKKIQAEQTIKPAEPEVVKEPIVKVEDKPKPVVAPKPAPEVKPAAAEPNPFGFDF